MLSLRVSQVLSMCTMQGGAAGLQPARQPNFQFTERSNPLEVQWRNSARRKNFIDTISKFGETVHSTPADI